MPSLYLIPLLAALASAWEIGQTVPTTSGTITGHASTWKLNVSEYLGVPYAQPPLGPLRWAAPVALRTPSAAYQGNKFGASCAANVRTPGKNESQTGILAVLGQVGDTFSEDCLTLNVWAKPQTGEAKKAVMVWVYGGGFNTGNSASPTYQGARLADEHDVIVVSMNYRLNVFGFPGLPFLPDNNLGLLDQRLAVEWVRDNIAAFGGDPERITLFGESAGGASVDYYAYAWTKDPIVKGFIPESGTASLGGAKDNLDAWYKATTKLGCGGKEAGAKTVDCARGKSMKEVLDAIKPEGVVPALDTSDFQPIADGKVVFPDYPARRAAGSFIKAPMLVGNNDNEAGLFAVLAQAGAAGAAAKAPSTSSSLAIELGNLRFTCPAGDAAKARRDAGVSAWRYRYAGEWPNQNIGPKAGAWHGSELGMVFGTTERTSNKPDTEEERKLSAKMREAWTTFAKDPVNGLTKLGWPLYDPAKPTLVLLGKPNSSEIAFVDNAPYDKNCGRLYAAVKGGTASKGFKL
ncbi:alpha/beta-hydrolase [Trichodelitschia bisporula]|uniref:Carboxylic ester hydrolase n=1 Tax=Trichodelitschia bisporula TaxID=703511 RepID=A0A6G1I303_9PEZI|nr:alpha/beta-hydrolase [Trichodelitschia bisporula]